MKNDNPVQKLTTHEIKKLSSKIINSTDKYLNKKLIQVLGKIDPISGNDLINMVIMILTNLSIKQYMYLSKFSHDEGCPIDYKQFITCFTDNFIDGINEVEKIVKKMKTH